MQLRSFAISTTALLVLALPPVASHAALTPPNLDVGAGVPEAGFPSFYSFQDIKVGLTKTGSGSGATYKLTADYAPSGSNNYNVFWLTDTIGGDITNGASNLVANFNSSGTFTGGTLTITGTISSLNVNVPGLTLPAPNSTLYTANLTGFGSDTTNNATPASIGFSTVATGGWAAQFQTVTESVYLFDFNVANLMASFRNPRFTSGIWNNASQYVTVPVPAALWLFGSAIAVFSRFRSRAVAAD
jgi:hypothetical protein